MKGSMLISAHTIIASAQRWSLSRKSCLSFNKSEWGRVNAQAVIFLVRTFRVLIVYLIKAVIHRKNGFVNILYTFP